MATTNDPIKKARLEKRSNQKMQKAKATWKDAETLKQEAIKSRNPADAGDAEQLYKKAARQGERAKRLKAKAAMMKTGGMVNANSKVSAIKVAGSKGVKSGVNPKAAPTKRATGRSGGTSTAPKTEIPKAQKGYSVADKFVTRGKASAIKAFEYGAPGRKDLRTARQENILMNDANLAKNRANKTKVAANKIKNAANKNKVAINKIRTTAKKAGLSYK